MSSSGHALRTALRFHRGILNQRTGVVISRVWVRCLSTQQQQPQQDRPFLWTLAAASVVSASGLTYFMIEKNRKTSLDPPEPPPLERAEDSWHGISATTLCEPRRQPRNVMLHRMRSVMARGLNDKYNVEWKTVLGEGAYGSVHPARLATTGEKVRNDRTCVCVCVSAFHGGGVTITG
jgi:hypothetical protein